MTLVRFVWRLILSPIGAAAAGIYLAYQGLIPQRERSDTGILIAVAFLIATSVVNYVEEQSLTRRMVSANLRITQRLTALIGSLGEISADTYHAWKVDLYTAHWRFGFSRSWPWVATRRLVRQASVSIVSTVGVLDTRELLDNGPVGRSFSTGAQVLWLSPDTNTPSALDIYQNLNTEMNAQLQVVCGAMRVVPVANNLEADCVGALAVHVEPKFAPRFGGTIVLDECATRLRAAAVDIHQIIRG